MNKTKWNLIPALIFSLLFVVLGCRKDDGLLQAVPERDRTEQQIADRDSLLDYLGTHYYNSDDFMMSANPSMNDLVITELESGESLPDGHTMLIDAVEIHNTLFLDVDYEYYILRLNQGGGIKSPNFPDEIRANYSGNLLDGAVFDSSVNSVVLDLSQLVPGWSRVIPEFNVAESFDLNMDGTVSFNNAGVGAMFIPSGLGYFSGGAVGIPVYSNLVFKFDIYQTEVADHDQDGVPSFIEDLDEDINLINDDTDGNQLANFIDPNDDGDEVLTINELMPKEYVVDTNIGQEEPVLGPNEFERNRSEVDGVITINTVTLMDSNSDGIWDYLDENIIIDYSEDN